MKLSRDLIRINDAYGLKYRETKPTIAYQAIVPPAW